MTKRRPEVELNEIGAEAAKCKKVSDAGERTCSGRPKPSKPHASGGLGILSAIYYAVLRSTLALRYRITTKGLDEVKRLRHEASGGILFLANHPAEIDPCILLRVLWPAFCPHPVAMESLFRIPFLRNLLDSIGALSIPSFDRSSNSFKKYQVEKTYARIFSYLDRGENVLIYPAGGLKQSGLEVVGGASGVHYILQKRPEVRVVLVRSSGLWGSSFSRALTGQTPQLAEAFWRGFKVLLKNGIFFAPRRRVEVECVWADASFPRGADRVGLNRYLEEWYNRSGPEPLTLVSYSFWRQELPQVVVSDSAAEKESLAAVPEGVKKQVCALLAALTKRPEAKILPEHHLAIDLGLDSLDMAQLVVSLKEELGMPDIPLNQLTTVGSLFLYASGVKKVREEELEESQATLWKDASRPHPAAYPEGELLIKMFLEQCDRMGTYVVAADNLVGEVSYAQLKLAVLLFAQAIRDLPGTRIGIMLPASVAVQVVIFATMLAGKVPVMINWTLGARTLRHIIAQSDIQVTISSWNFLDKLNNIDLNGLDEQIVLLEELRHRFTLWQKVTAFFRARKKADRLLRLFDVASLAPSDPAVVLFTSGTESTPKGVPLTHHNLVANQRAAQQYITIQDDDVMLGALPPFHSFGFSVTGLLPLLAGLRVIYYPNPTEGKRLAATIERWQVTLICLAPTFLKNLLRAASAEQLRSLRMIVLGAERAPAELFEQIKLKVPQAEVIEGYGITECAPILTLNPPHAPSTGVGKPIPGVDLLIVNPDTMEPVGTGSPGLILAHGPNIFPGYLNTQHLSPFIWMEGKKWYQTGDLGFLDQRGYLTLSGRMKRFVKVGGEMVSLGAVEEALIHAAASAGWQLDEALPSLAICALEQEGKKSELHLFTSVDTDVETVNRLLREQGMSNLIKIKTVRRLPLIPLLGTGKVDYGKLMNYIMGTRDV